MFTGIIKQMADVVASHSDNESLYLEISFPAGFNLTLGGSVAINGVCTTVTSATDKVFMVELMSETLRLTSFGEMVPGTVNLELPMRLSDRLNGHIVQGHVDAVGHIMTIRGDGNAKVYTISFPGHFNSQIIQKGSVTVDGVSLTVTEIMDSQFSVSLLEYTLAHTVLGGKTEGDLVNLEFDMMAKYVARILSVTGKKE